MEKRKNIPKAFILFLIASFSIWSLIKLSKEYTTTLTYEVNYVNLPQDKIFQKEPIKTIDIAIRSSGFKLLAANVNREAINLNIAQVAESKGNKQLFSLLEQRIEIQKQLRSGLIIEQFTPTAIPLELGTLTTKKIPVTANLDINYHLGYSSAAPVKTKPDSLLVSGTKEQLKNISSISLEQLTLNDVSENFSKPLKIIIPKGYENLRFNKEVVVVEGFVDKFTEGEFEISFDIKNVPSDIKINTYPKKVKVFYKVGLKNFNKIKPNNFSVECDFKEVNDNNINYLIPKLIQKPALVNAVRIAPSKIEYLISK